MAIIIVSRGSYTHGKMVAEKLAEKLGYECVGREILIEASKEFNIPELKLTMAIKNAPSILDKFTYGKERYVAYIQAAFLKYIKKDNVVYHGFAGHFFVRDINNILKVRINADIELRIKLVMEKENISREEAIKFITNVDEERRSWSKHLYGIDTNDTNLYNMVFKIGRIPVDETVNCIWNIINKGYFNMDENSKKKIEDMSLAAEAKAALMNISPDLEVYAKDGLIYVRGKAALIHGDRLISDIEKTIKEIPGVKEVKISISSKFIDV